MSRLLKFINFGRSGKIHAEALPLLGIMGIALTGVTSFCIYALFTKNDVMLNHHSKIPPWEKSIDQLNPKIINLHSIPKLNPEVRKLKDEINSSD